MPSPEENCVQKGICCHNTTKYIKIDNISIFPYQCELIGNTYFLYCIRSEEIQWIEEKRSNKTPIANFTTHWNTI